MYFILRRSLTILNGGVVLEDACPGSSYRMEFIGEVSIVSCMSPWMSTVCVLVGGVERRIS